MLMYRTLQGVLIVAFVLLPQAQAAAAPRLGDQAISDAVEDELQHDPAVPPAGIDVTTKEGMVTLTGTVDNILAKDRATRVAEAVKGVIGVRNDITVRPGEKIPDAALASRVREALHLNPATGRFNTTVAVSHGVVKLSGTARSFQEKKIAETVAKGVRGVMAVINDITLSYAVKRSDPDIEADIDQALTWDALVNAGDIDANVKNGVVQLTGMVASAAERTRAVSDAWVAGVTAVDAAGLTVSAWNDRRRFAGNKVIRKSDRDTQQAVDRVLRTDPLVHAFALKPEVQDGVVTLRGTVDNLQAKRAAAADAMTVTGVAWVNNRIKVAPGIDTTDGEIMKRVSNALSVDPYVSRPDVRIGVRNGIVTLHGAADSYFDKMRAEAVVAAVKGVKAVDNELRVEHVSGIGAADPYKYDYYVYKQDWYTGAEQGRNGGKSDRQIAREIKQELARTPFVDAEEVTVAVNQGVATLSGTVDTRSEARIATAKAFEGGAREVINALNVRGES